MSVEERERERENESVLKRKTRDNHRERERSDPPHKGASVQKLGSLFVPFSVSKKQKKKKHAPAAAARLNPPRARANTCSSL